MSSLADADAGSVLVEAQPGQNILATMLLVSSIEQERWRGVPPGLARMVVRVSGELGDGPDPVSIKEWALATGAVADQVALSAVCRHGRTWELECLSRDGNSTVVLGPPA